MEAALGLSTTLFSSDNRNRGPVASDTQQNDKELNTTRNEKSTEWIIMLQGVVTILLLRKETNIFS